MKFKRFFALAIVLAMMFSSAAIAEGNWWNILLLGSDNRYDMGESYSRTDSMIILSVNLTTKQAKMTSLMRDTWVPIEGHGKNKLNAASVFGGPELTMKTINKQFGTDISNYILINITGMADVIDVLGGLDLDVTEDERKALNRGLFDLSSQSGMEKLEESGENVHLNGNQAVAYARIRVLDSDYVRTERQRTVLMKLAQKLKEVSSASTAVAMVNTLLPYVETNLSPTDLVALAYVGLNMDMENMDGLRLPADGTFNSGTFDGVWCIKPNFEKNRNILHKFIYGE